MKNLKSNLMNFANIVIGILVYVFLSQTYIGSGEGKLYFEVANGYDIIGNYFKGNGTEVMMALSNLIVAIFAGILILTSIYLILINLGAFKKSKSFKQVNFINIIISIILAIFSAISLFCTVGYVNGDLQKVFAYSVGWAIIVNFIMSIATIITTILSSKFSKK